MPEFKESPIFSKTYDMLLWIYQHTSHFPKSERFRLAKRIEDTAFALQTFLLKAVGPVKDGSALLQADFQLVQLRFLLRLSKDMHFTSQSQYEHCMGMLLEIGKLLGAWIKRTPQSQD